MIQAVLFDFDGVIANSLEYHVQAWQEIFNPFGVKITYNDIAVEEGARAIEIISQFAKKKNLKFSRSQLEKFTAQKRKIYRKITKAHIYPEIKEFIANLKTYPIKLGLVTGSVIPAMKVVVGNNFFNNFDVVITADDVIKGKPDPESYLKAAEKLNILPQNCLVIENAPHGINAAKSAGMTCIALRTTIKNDDILKNADMIYNNVSEIDIDKELL